MINPDGVRGCVDGSIFLRERGAAESEDMRQGLKRGAEKEKALANFAEYKGVIHPTLINRQLRVNVLEKSSMQKKGGTNGNLFVPGGQ
jgi:hypothetical protein